jgi:hypothetical protein
MALLNLSQYIKFLLWLIDKIQIILVPHCNVNPVYVFLFWELRGLSPNFDIHVSVSNLYIPRIGLHMYVHLLQQNRQIDRGNI